MFAVLGPLLLLLAAIGIYAVVAYAVTLRTAEIGVRLALGATTRRLIGQFVGEHLLIVGVGALAGWLLAFAAVVIMLSAPLDVAVFAGVPALLLTVAVAASWWPARRVALRRSDARAARGVSQGSGSGTGLGPEGFRGSQLVAAIPTQCRARQKRRWSPETDPRSPIPDPDPRSRRPG